MGYILWFTQPRVLTLFIMAVIISQAVHLGAALHQSEPERIAATTRRRQRLVNFRNLQDQLLEYPHIGDGESKRHRRESGTSHDDNWKLAEDSAQRDRAQRAHFHAARAAANGGNKVWMRARVSQMVGSGDSIIFLDSHFKLYGEGRPWSDLHLVHVYSEKVTGEDVVGTPCHRHSKREY